MNGNKIVGSLIVQKRDMSLCYNSAIDLIVVVTSVVCGTVRDGDTPIKGRPPTDLLLKQVVISSVRRFVCLF